MRWLSCVVTVIILVVGIGAPAGAANPVPIIFDTDMGNDIDDALALGLIHALESRGECRLLAVTVTKDSAYSAPYCDIVNTFYGRGDIPIGVVRDGKTPEESSYTKPVVTATDNGRLRYSHDLKHGDETPNATTLLRRVLAAEEDGSVAVIQVGFSTNLARLLESKPDDISKLDGVALVRKKVRLLSAMAGAFSEDLAASRFKEYNVVKDVTSAQRVFHDWPTPVVMSGFEIGRAILYPATSIERDYTYVDHHPVAEGYRLYMKMPYDRPTWDLTSVLHAVRPNGRDFGMSVKGSVTVEDDGRTRFEASSFGTRRYLTVTPKQIAEVRRTFVTLCSRRPSK